MIRQEPWDIAISAALNRAVYADLSYRDAMRAIAQDIPDPRDYAAWAPLWIVEALFSAYKTNSEGWVVPREVAAELRPFGLVGYGTCGLTVFGWRVRQVLKEHDA